MHLIDAGAADADGERSPSPSGPMASGGPLVDEWTGRRI
jgi:hypothetical protein